MTHPTIPSSVEAGQKPCANPPHTPVPLPVRIQRHVDSLRALSCWLIANDHDMSLPDDVDVDPAESAELLATLLPEDGVTIPADDPVGALLICDQTGGRMWTCWPVEERKKQEAGSLYGDTGGYRVVPLYSAPKAPPVSQPEATLRAEAAEGVADAVHSALWKADAEVARLRLLFASMPVDADYATAEDFRRAVNEWWDRGYAALTPSGATEQGDGE